MRCELNDRDVHLWYASLSAAASSVDGFLGTLSELERARAQRFRTPEASRRFIVARGILRSLLARYLHLTPHAIVFQYGPYGKPRLAPSHEARDLEFSLAHTGDAAVYAITRMYPIGTDIENVHRTVAVDDIVKRFFTQREADELRAFPEKNKRTAFFSYWTCKEAYLKALGSGLSVPLNSFSVSLRPEAPIILGAHGEETAEFSRWSLRLFHPDSDHLCALATTGSELVIRHWRWRQD